jgi:hypothetical protein
MTVITQTATVNEFTRLLIHLRVFQQGQLPCARTELTALVNIDVELVLTMAA